MRLLTVIGARPQIIKAAAISRAAASLGPTVVEERILHTGQHYDTNMSQIFFDELGIAPAHYNLGVGSGQHGQQTAKMIAGIEEVLLSDHFDGMILYGDTNSTLAGAVAASKLHVPVFHIEAGLRSFNMAMPEEVNRIVCDQLSHICFAPTQTAVNNLHREGFANSPATFADGRKRKICLSGDVMYDNSMHYGAIARERCTILEQLGVSPNGYILTTIHRDNNTDHPDRLRSILLALADIASQEHIPVILPLHPRTRAKLAASSDAAVSQAISRLTVIPPASFFEISMLEQHAHIVMTDSGGVQKEAFFYERPCVILRPETEWVEIVEHGAGIIADADYSRIVQAYQELCGKEVHFPPLFGDAHAAEKILSEIIAYLN